MSVVSVRKHLKKYNMENKILTFSDTSKTVKEAALRLNCTEDEIAKTLSFYLDDNTYILIVVSGNSKIDNAKYKVYFKTKAHMIPYELVEEKIGHAPGGVCPFGVNNGVKIYFDESLKKYDYVYPACGEENNAIKISIDELEKIVNYEKWIDVSKSMI